MTTIDHVKEKARQIAETFELTRTETTRQDIERGWRRWVGFAGLEECQTSAEQAGFLFAAWQNDNAGGSRPKGSDATEEAAFLMQFARVPSDPVTISNEINEKIEHHAIYVYAYRWRGDRRAMKKADRNREATYLTIKVDLDLPATHPKVETIARELEEVLKRHGV